MAETCASMEKIIAGPSLMVRAAVVIVLVLSATMVFAMATTDHSRVNDNDIDSLMELHGVTAVNVAPGSGDIVVMVENEADRPGIPLSFQGRNVVVVVTGKIKAL